MGNTLCRSVVVIAILNARSLWAVREGRKERPTLHYIRKYGSTFYIGIAMIVLPYFGPWENWNLSFHFQFPSNNYLDSTHMTPCIIQIDYTPWVYGPTWVCGNILIVPL